MIDVMPYDECVCRRMGNAHGLCEAELTFSEKGKKVRLSIRPSEEVKAVVLDDCVFRDNKLKCDGLFLYRSDTKKAALLVELKGAGDIPHAFAQLAYVRKSRPEYRDLVDKLRQTDGPGQVIEKAFIVSSGQLSRPRIETLENQYDIRISALLHSKAISSIPDLRDYL